MTKNDFIEIMTRFQASYEIAEARLNKIYDALGADCVETFCDISFEPILIDTISKGFSQDRQEIVKDNIEYLIYECGFNLADFQDRVWIDDDGIEKHPIITTFEDFYNFLREG